MFVRLMKKNKNLIKGKKGIELETLILWIIALVILIVLVVASVVLRNRGVNALDYIRNLFRSR